MVGQKLLKHIVHVREEATDIAIMYLHYWSSWIFKYQRHSQWPVQVKEEHTCGYYAQVQGQLVLTGLNEMCVHRIYFDKYYWENKLLPNYHSFSCIMHCNSESLLAKQDQWTVVQKVQKRPFLWTVFRQFNKYYDKIVNIMSGMLSMSTSLWNTINQLFNTDKHWCKYNTFVLVHC